MWDVEQQPWPLALASTYEYHTLPLPLVVVIKKCLQTLANASWKAKITPTENHCTKQVA